MSSNMTVSSSYLQDTLVTSSYLPSYGFTLCFCSQSLTVNVSQKNRFCFCSNSHSLSFIRILFCFYECSLYFNHRIYLFSKYLLYFCEPLAFRRCLPFYFCLIFLQIIIITYYIRNTIFFPSTLAKLLFLRLIPDLIFK